ncbi:MAG: response regulator [Proteobacteria bacterium]|nr:response regulator [Pseudomonadota bacterium]
MKRILFVDDEPNVLSGLRRMLRVYRKEWDMSFAGGGEAALAQLDSGHFDVLVTDMRMPGVNGAELLAQAQQRWPEVVRIVLSGHTELEAALRAVPVAHQFLVKPCNPEVLKQAIERACDLHVLLRREEIRRAVSKVGSLPSVPRVHMAVTKALAEPDVDIGKVAQLIEQDAAMSAKTLQLVNSAFFGLPRRVARVAEAASLLGTNMLKNLVLSIDVFRCFNTSDKAALAVMEAQQEHALMAACIAMRIVSDRRASEDAYMSALLHDVGKLVMLAQLPAEFRIISERAQAEGREPHEIEREVLGAPHAHIGAYLLGVWGLPYTIVEAVAHHHEPDAAPGEEFGVLGAVHVADVLAHEVSSREDPTGPSFDYEYLERVGVVARLSEWSELAQGLTSAVAKAVLR